LQFGGIGGTIRCDDQQGGMTETQIDRIRKAEEAIRELVQLAAQIRQEADKLPIEDPAVHKELLETAEGFENQAQDLRNVLREWREDIH
jgi:chorismate mutase